MSAVAYKTNEDNGLSHYKAEIKKHDLISHDEMITLANLARNGDMKARSKMVERNLRLVLHIAKSYLRSGMPYEDIVAAGNEGLVIAADKFNPDLNFAFSTYADRWIRFKIEDQLIKNKSVHIPVHVVKAANKVLKTRRSLEQSLHREVLDSEVAANLDMDETSVRRLSEAVQFSYSLDASLDDEGGGEASFVSFLEDNCNPLNEIEEMDTSVMIKEIIAKLNDREKYIITHYFGMDGKTEMNLAEMGREMNISRERCRQLLKGALDRLQDLLEEQGLSVEDLAA